MIGLVWVGDRPLLCPGLEDTPSAFLQRERDRDRTGMVAGVLMGRKARIGREALMPGLVEERDCEEGAWFTLGQGDHGLGIDPVAVLRVGRLGLTRRGTAAGRNGVRCWEAMCRDDGFDDGHVHAEIGFAEIARADAGMNVVRPLHGQRPGRHREGRDRSLARLAVGELKMRHGLPPRGRALRQLPIG
ncbi:hypothetical protein M2324_002354 [Rhodovulum sulfidophilum]|uniref:hypothetical protein n=1 Tax=Rhodovulum sulfidophilum TaxID=35806 RepID=UPI0012DA785F|nr:hypothetical protein [Rhodovulum sulfidophilum]MCW2303950.1 hypothetical protein [Rhodovulum sulfidophilum]